MDAHFNPEKLAASQPATYRRQCERAHHATERIIRIRRKYPLRSHAAIGREVGHSSVASAS